MQIFVILGGSGEASQIFDTLLKNHLKARWENQNKIIKETTIHIY